MILSQGESIFGQWKSWDSISKMSINPALASAGKNVQVLPRGGASVTFKVGVVRACYGAYFVAHVFKYLVPNFEQLPSYFYLLTERIQFVYLDRSIYSWCALSSY